MNVEEINILLNETIDEKNKLIKERTENPSNIGKYMCLKNDLKYMILTIGVIEEEKFIIASLAKYYNSGKFLREYYEYMKNYNNNFPSFIFDDYDPYIFKKVMIFKNKKHSLSQTEEYYKDLVYSNEEIRVRK